MFWRREPGDAPVVVLYADDDENDLFFVQRAFARWRPDVQLRTVKNGQEAMDFLSASLRQECGEDLPQLVILDLKMPYPGGLEVLEWIRNDETLRGLPTVVLSSSDRPSDQQKAAALGATHYIVKSSAFLELPDQLARWLPPVRTHESNRTDAAEIRPERSAGWPILSIPAGAH